MNTMNKILTAAVMVAGIVLTSCGASDAPDVDKSIIPAADSNKTMALPAATQVQQPVIQPAAPGGVQTVSTPQTVPAAQVTPAKQISSAGGLNPAHGQPGHRCDIAVGAPLNSAPTTATKPQVQTAAPTMTPPTAVPAAATADPNAKLNPAHGQPGHDCAIPVGAPLKG